MNKVDANAPTAATPPPASLFDVFKDLWKELPGLLNDRLELLGAEIDRAGMALLQICQLAVAFSVLGIGAWILLWCFAISGLVWLGLHWMAALLTGLLVHLALLAWMYLRVKKLVPLLGLPVTRRRLRFTRQPQVEKPASASQPQPLVRTPPTVHRDAAPNV